jgi:hypothetical protein
MDGSRAEHRVDGWVAKLIMFLGSVLSTRWMVTFKINEEGEGLREFFVGNFCVMKCLRSNKRRNAVTITAGLRCALI